MKRRSSGIDWLCKVDDETVTVIQEILAAVKKEDLTRP